jgi:hypothetical protein
MSNGHKDWIADFSPRQRENYELCIKYPILVPYENVAAVMTCVEPYDFTLLDYIPDGWRNAFGEAWARDIQEAVDDYYKDLKEHNIEVDEFNELYILQLKEKYGAFTQYFSHYTPKLNEIIKKYQDLSETICINCGKSAKYRTTSCVSPFCEDCIQLVHDRFEKI